MPNYLKINFIVVFLLLMVFAGGEQLMAQNFGNTKSVKVDELSDDQIRMMMQRAKSMGYSDQNIIQYAKSEGLSTVEISKLTRRISKIRIEDNKGKETSTKNDEARKKQALTEYLTALALEGEKESLELENLPINQNFGYSVFNNETRELSFETNLDFPPPPDYILGVGDEIVIDIFGASEWNYTELIQPNGQLFLSNVGPMYLNGLTLAEAEKRIKTRLTSVYPELTGAKATTFLQVSVGIVRNISVNIVGEVNVPGTYTVNALSTVFNGLYAAGGPTLMGTLRDIKVYRNGKEVTVVDIYQFLVFGKTNSNIRLQHDDVIIVGPYANRINIEGAIKRPGYYQMLDGETFESLLKYTGGFTSDAYQKKINLVRNSTEKKQISNIYDSQFSIFEIKDGDQYLVGEIQGTFENRVMIKGSVNRPGNYALTDQMTLMNLIQVANGITGDAFTGRVLITRMRDDFSIETISADLSKIIQGAQPDISLKKEDVIQISSIYDLEEEQFIRLSGEVNSPGVYRYAENLSIEDLLFQANGFKRAAKGGTLFISRRPAQQSANAQIESLQLSINEDLGLSAGEYQLRPFDHVIVRRNPNYYEEKTVQIVGQINLPGTYPIESTNQRISDIISKAGGLNEFAYPEGATLIRKTEFHVSNQEQYQRRLNLTNFLNGLDTAMYSESDLLLISKINEEMTYSNKQNSESAENFTALAKKNRIQELANSGIQTNLNNKEAESIALDLKKLMAQKGSPEDLILEDGDIISIPKKLSTIRVMGKILYPNTLQYEASKSVKHYIGQAGGFSNRAKKKHTYVVYANGNAARTSSFLFFKSYPKVAPGAEVIVPEKPVKIGVNTGDLIAITSSLITSLTLVAITLLNKQ